MNKGFEMTLEDLSRHLLKEREKISTTALEKELRPLLPADELLGLDLKIRVAIEQLVLFLKD